MKKIEISKETIKYWSIYIGIAIVAIVFDQLSKWLLEAPLAGGKNIPIIGNWFTLKWALNPGAAFGIFKGKSWLFFVFTLIGVPLFVFLISYSRKRSKWGQLGFSFMLGGTIGNAIDRLFLGDGFYNGLVRDFFRVEGFAIFNIADSFIVVGGIMACLALLVFDHDSLIGSALQKNKTVAEVEGQSQKSDNCNTQGQQSEGMVCPVTDKTGQPTEDSSQQSISTDGATQPSEKN